MTDGLRGPHEGQPMAAAGAPLDAARVAMVMVHGRGASAESILDLARLFPGEAVAYLAPQAAGFSWYPHSFLAPLADNEPGISSGIAAIRGAVTQAVEAGIPHDRVVVLGFSQGACLALESAARHPVRLGGVVALSGGLIGSADIDGASPPGDKEFVYEGSLAGTPVFLGCSDVDAHIPVGRVHRSAEVMRGLGATVTERIYPGMGHTVNADEAAFVRALLERLAA